MRKTISSILMIVILLANFFAPVSVGWGDKKIEVEKNIIEAEYTTSIQIIATSQGTTITAEVIAIFSGTGINVNTASVFLYDEDPGDENRGWKDIKPYKEKTIFADMTNKQVFNGGEIENKEIVTFSDLKENTKYYLIGITGQSSVVGKAFQSMFNPKKLFEADSSSGYTNTISITTDKKESTEIIKASGIAQSSNFSVMPVCGIDAVNGGSLGGCIAQVIYYLLFVPSSFLFALAGTFFDWTFNYSVQSSTYKSEFVVQGWNIVRDFCNMFFIFVLLYIAFKTILDLHGSKTKEMIINVVIIGLLINFSLFAARVIIDTSNILARVFYNSTAIKITAVQDGVDANNIIAKADETGVIPLSAALVNKVDPQSLIIKATNVGEIKDTAGQSQKTERGGVTTGTFMIVTLLASAVNIIGFMVFLSVGLIFVARVIGLWLAMIIVPFAFFSYTVPYMQDMEMVGWKKWWPETLKLAFLAPVFIFFLYLILQFLEKGLGIMDASNKTGLDFVVAIVVPFAFIMVLLWKAKDIAKKMSGTMGQSITNGVAAAGGLALGGAALGVAALGRGTIGAFMKGASTGDTSAQRLAAGDPTLSRFGRFKGRLQQISGLDALQQNVGARLNANQADIARAAHSRHDLDVAAGVVAPGKKWSELNGDQRLQARTNLERTLEIRSTAGIQNLTWAQLSPAQQATITAAIAPRLATNTTTADTTLIPRARRKVGLGENIIQSTIDGSFDIRNLSKIIAGEQDRGMNKFATGLTSMLASGMRSTLKQANFNYGTGQKEFIKDLGHTITEALKSTTIKVDLSHVGEEKKEEHGGGHH